MTEHRKSAPDSAVAPPVSSSVMSSLPTKPRSSIIDQEWLDEDTQTSRPTELSIDLPNAMSGRKVQYPVVTVVSGFNAGQIFRLEEPEVIIGRGREAHIRIEEAGVSRLHVKLTKLEGGRCAVEDLASTNGTFVRGQRVARGEVSAGEELRVGPTVRLSFTMLDESSERLARQLFESSTRDALTGAYNRKYLIERLDSEVAYANRHRSKLAIILFDLDRFKQVNDNFSHLAGDAVLKAVAEHVQRKIRVEDVLARYGGEEFVVLVRGIDHENVSVFAERLRRSLERLAIPWDGTALRPTISAGVASIHECGENPTAGGLLLLTDSRLYAAKMAGRNRVVSA